MLPKILYGNNTNHNYEVYLIAQIQGAAKREGL